jgi:hypothetical protein
VEITKSGAGFIGTSSLAVELSVGRSTSEAARGFDMALARLRGVISDSLSGDTYIYLAEALMWLAVLAEQRPEIRGAEDVVALVYARERAHHQLASLIYPTDAGLWHWRPADQLPTSRNEKHRGLRHRPIYERRLEGKPMIEALERVEKLLASS